MTINATSDRKITVLLVDDHPMVQDGLTACLSYYDDIQVVAACTNGKDALDKALSLKPDVILMDVSMPIMNGIDATEIITDKIPDTKILIFSMHESSEFVTSSIQAGASGYISKDTTSEGKTHFSSSIAMSLIENPIRPENEKLTTREQVILTWIARGLSSKEVARKLNISYRTVEAHRRNIRTKLNIESLAELVRYAVNHGLVDP
jgi:two-component system nitrate/nitrite response regulator NarL